MRVSQQDFWNNIPPVNWKGTKEEWIIKKKKQQQSFNLNNPLDNANPYGNIEIQDQS